MNSKVSKGSPKNQKVLEPHIFDYYKMNIDKFTQYLADKYIVDAQQKQIFLGKDVWLKVKLNYIAGLILKTNGKEIFAPKDIREVLCQDIIPSLTEISSKQLNGCIITQDLCPNSPDPKWHNGFPCLEKVDNGKYRFIGFATKN